MVQYGIASVTVKFNLINCIKKFIYIFCHFTKSKMHGSSSYNISPLPYVAIICLVWLKVFR